MFLMSFSLSRSRKIETADMEIWRRNTPIEGGQMIVKRVIVMIMLKQNLCLPLGIFSTQSRSKKMLTQP